MSIYNYSKLTIFTFVVLIFITVLTIVAYAKDSGQPTVKEAEEPEQEISQHIENIAENYFNHSEKINNPQQILSKEKLKELEGHINKEYGIREDILRFIEREIPAENEKAKYAAIRYAQASNIIYYHASQTEVIKTANKKIIALNCLANCYEDDEWLKISRGISQLMHNTPLRDQHMWEIDKKFFGWKVVGNGVSTNKLKEICDSKEF